MWALLVAAPPKWTTSKAPGCTPKDPSGRDMGCSNNPSTLTFHKDPIPHVPQEFIQSPAGYTKLRKMFYSNMAKQAQFKKSRDRSAAYDAALNGRSAQPLNPSSDAQPAQPATDYVCDAPRDDAGAAAGAARNRRPEAAVGRRARRRRAGRAVCGRGWCAVSFEL